MSSALESAGLVPGCAGNEFCHHLREKKKWLFPSRNSREKRDNPLKTQGVVQEMAGFSG